MPNPDHPWDMKKVRDSFSKLNKRLMKTEHSLYQLCVSFIEQTGMKPEQFYILNMNGKKCDISPYNQAAYRLSGHSGISVNINSVMEIIPLDNESIRIAKIYIHWSIQLLSEKKCKLVIGINEDIIYRKEFDFVSKPLYEGKEKEVYQAIFSFIEENQHRLIGEKPVFQGYEDKLSSIYKPT